MRTIKGNYSLAAFRLLVRVGQLTSRCPIS